MAPQSSPNNVSNLRDHLDAARAAYHSERYPGDLAEELLGQPRRRIIPWTIVATAVTGIAAALLFWIGAGPDPLLDKPTPAGPEMVAVVPAPITASEEYVETITMPTMPDYFEVTPAAEDLSSIPAIPSFPRIDYASDFPSTDTSTQESA